VQSLLDTQPLHAAHLRHQLRVLHPLCKKLKKSN